MLRTPPLVFPARLSVLEALDFMVTLIVLISSLAVGQSPVATDENGRPAGVEFSWLSGHWVSETEVRRTEEIWTGADGALMTGMNRTVGADGRTRFEFIRIEFGAGGEAPAYIAQPSGGAPIRFILIESGAQTAVFANPDHDFPTHIAYARDGDTLTARIWGADGEAGAIGWSWTLRAP